MIWGDRETVYNNKKLRVSMSVGGMTEGKNIVNKFKVPLTVSSLGTSPKVVCSPDQSSEVGKRMI